MVEGLVVGRGVVAMASAGWGVAKGEELSTSPIAASSCRVHFILIIIRISQIEHAHKKTQKTYMYLWLPSLGRHDASICWWTNPCLHGNRATPLSPSTANPRSDFCVSLLRLQHQPLQSGLTEKSYTLWNNLTILVTCIEISDESGTIGFDTWKQLICLIYLVHINFAKITQTQGQVVHLTIILDSVGRKWVLG